MKYILNILFIFLTNQIMADFLKPVIIRNNTEDFSLLPFVEVLPNPQENLTFEEASSQEYHAKFMPYNKQIGLFPDKNVAWVRFTLTNDSKADDWLLDFGSNYDSMTLYSIDNEQKVTVYTQSSQTATTQIVKYYGIANYLPLDIHQKATNTYYLRLQLYKNIVLQNKGTFKGSHNIIVQPENIVKNDFEQRKYLGSAYTAIYLIMTFYIFVLFIYFRDKSYLYFSLMLFSTALMSLFPLDTFCAFFGLNKVQESYLYFFSFLLPCFFLLLFARSYLLLSHYTPIWDRIIIGLLALVTLYWLLALFNVWVIILGLSIIVCAIFVVLFAGIVVVTKGYKPARYFLMANIFYLLGWTLTILTAFNIIGSRSLAINGRSIGGIFQILLFAVGLLYRLEEMRKEIETGKEERQKMIETQNERLEKEVTARTSELQASEEELRQNMEELETNQEVIKNQRDRLEKAFEELEGKNLRITDSIRYAKRIQGAVLPHEDVLKNNFEEHLLIFRPKDVVSGDFYWYDEVAERKFLAVVDCTGHGVPGAFMSMIGNTLLDEIINTKHIFEPHLILDQLHKSIIAALGSEGGHLQDGMDVALCCIQAQENNKFLVKYSGAKRPIFYFSNGELKEAAGTKKSIGQTNAAAYFELHTFLMNKGDIIYLTTDGVTDIINSKRQRLGSKHFKEMLVQNAYLPLAIQKEAFLQELDSFQENTEQRDDILFLAVKL
ncbi:MAG: hypothetical protein EAZ08_07690 [Cytophagales bacterium]|nr:MAG: hypothetical protein EAZ08_07690 [Cytophagales bacterium]